MKSNDVVTTTFTQPKLSAPVATDISDVTDTAIGSTASTKITEVPELITDFNNWHIIPAIDYTLYDIDNDNKDEVLILAEGSLLYNCRELHVYRIENSGFKYFGSIDTMLQSELNSNITDLKTDFRT